MPSKITITSPSRLSFSLLDLNGELGRVDGGLGLALDRPCFALDAHRAKGVSVTSRAGKYPRLEQRVRRIASAFSDRFHIGGIDVLIRDSLPRYSLSLDSPPLGPSVQGT